jgi:PPE-repeat protein
VISGLDFGALPPEVNSTRMYSGAGSGPMATAAAAWNGLAAELNSAATSYQTLVSELTSGLWVGPSSMSMTAAAASYVSWMSTTAAQAVRSASQLGSAVAAYEAAFAATVPPSEIEVNRALLAALVATNAFGQNTPAIAATETRYAEMWAQDAAAMYSYAAASAAATTLKAFTAPTQQTDPAGTANQAAAVAQATASATGTSTQSALSSVPNLLQSLSSGSVSNSLLNILTSNPIQAFNSITGSTAGYQILSEGLNFDASGLMLTIAPAVAVGWNPLISALSAPASAAAASDIAGVPGASAGGLGSTLVDSSTHPLSTGGAEVSAGLGEASTVGRLSVPSSWATPTQVRLASAATALPAAGLEGLAWPGVAGPGSLFGGMPPMGPVASVVNAPRGEQTRVRAGSRHKVVASMYGDSGMNEDPAGRWVKPGATADDGAVSERDELNQLRKALADVARQRDVLKRTAATMIQEATDK